MNNNRWSCEIFRTTRTPLSRLGGESRVRSLEVIWTGTFSETPFMTIVMFRSGKYPQMGSKPDPVQVPSLCESDTAPVQREQQNYSRHENATKVVGNPL